MHPRTTIGVVCSLGAGAARGGRAGNEDNYLVCRDGEMRWRDGDREVVRRRRGAGVLLVVADGMGGHEDGALASTAAVQAMSLLYAQGRPEAPELALHGFVLKAHRRIRETVAQRGPIRMGTTLTGAWLLERRLYWVHVGDSRLYLYREGALSRLTMDQTRGAFARRDRRPLPPDADQLAQTFIYGSRGLGDDAAIRVDPGRDSGAVVLRAGDRLLACTDGLTGFVDDVGITDVLREVPAPAAAAELLVERALARGSDDNITAVVVRVDDLPAAASADDLPPGPDDGLVP